MAKEVILRSQTEVLEWLHEHHPALHAVAEIDRAWIWLPVDLRGDQNEATRVSIKNFGFSFASQGHPLESGANGTWAHHCDAPLPFRRRGRRNRAESEKNDEKQPETNDWQARAAALFGQ